MRARWLPPLLLALALAGSGRARGGEVLLADFERPDYGEWRAEGTAFGSGPGRGALPGQQPVSGYLGRGLVNSFLGGDGPQGSLLSPPFRISRRYLNFRIGGGRHPGRTGMELLVEGKVLRTATGSATTPADDEHLTPHTWELGRLAGRTARLRIVDRHSGGWGHINVDHITLSDRPLLAPAAGEAVTRAMASVEGARGRAEADELRPAYHFRPPALWMNDPNGPIFHGGYYHLFYQHNPYGDRWEHMHWGHARSRDLARWEHLPIALAPSEGEGEAHCFSGCAALDARGRPLLFYTSIGPRRQPSDGAEQWAAVPEDDAWIAWKKHPANPILHERLHGALKVYDWRDPYLFRHEGQTYLVLGGNLNRGAGGQAVVLLYRAEDPELTRWQYRGILFRHPDRTVPNIECPNFFRLGERWVLIVSPHGPVQYFTGRFDPEKPEFVPESRGVLDPGSFYAPNSLEHPQGRLLLWGWVTGFPGGRGWNGCLTLPRVLTGGEDGLRQEPAPEIAKLRGRRRAVPGFRLDGGSRALDPIRGDALELAAVFRPEGAGAFGFRVRGSEDGSRSVTVRIGADHLEVDGARSPLTLRPGEGVRLRVFIDRSVVEAYAGGRAVTRVVTAPAGDVAVRAFAEGGAVRIDEIQAWRMKPGFAGP